MPNSKLNEYLLNSPSGDAWRRVGTHKRAGAVVPLFSVYSKKSIGIGDLADLRMVIDWCALTGNSILQLLPINEVGPLSCPYDSISSFAIEPAYICLDDASIPENAQAEKKKKELRRVFPCGRRFVNYEVKREKIKLLWEVYSQGILECTEELSRFREQNS